MAGKGMNVYLVVSIIILISLLFISMAVIIRTKDEAVEYAEAFGCEPGCAFSLSGTANVKKDMKSNRIVLEIGDTEIVRCANTNDKPDKIKIIAGEPLLEEVAAAEKTDSDPPRWLLPGSRIEIKMPLIISAEKFSGRIYEMRPGSIYNISGVGFVRSGSSTANISVLYGGTAHEIPLSDIIDKMAQKTYSGSGCSERRLSKSEMSAANTGMWFKSVSDDSMRLRKEFGDSEVYVWVYNDMYDCDEDRVYMSPTIEIEVVGESDDLSKNLEKYGRFARAKTDLIISWSDRVLCRQGCSKVTTPAECHRMPYFNSDCARTTRRLCDLRAIGKAVSKEMELYGTIESTPAFEKLGCSGGTPYGQEFYAAPVVVEKGRYYDPYEEMADKYKYMHGVTMIDIIGMHRACVPANSLTDDERQSLSNPTPFQSFEDCATYVASRVIQEDITYIAGPACLDREKWECVPEPYAGKCDEMYGSFIECEKERFAERVAAEMGMLWCDISCSLSDISSMSGGKMCVIQIGDGDERSN